MEDEKILIILVVSSFLLLGFSLFANINGIFNFLANPLIGDGLGTLCNSEQDCKDFCQNNFGRCMSYCADNPSNELCDRFGEIKWKLIWINF